MKICPQCHKNQLRSWIRRTSNVLTIGEMSLDDGGVRQQSVRNSFTKDKAGTLPFYMYMSEESCKNAEEQALTSMQELFKAVSSAKEADTPTNPPGNSSSWDEEPVTEPGNGNQSDLNTHQAPHTGIYAIRSKSNFFSVFISSKIDANDIVGTNYCLLFCLPKIVQIN